MLNKKINYFRKKNMLTQEELSEKLCVSRQTITKWESGVIIPSLEYLIDLSDLFGVTIDTLVKSDDCQTYEHEEISLNALRSFLVDAKKSTYAAKQGRVEPYRIDTHDYMYEDENYKYHDSFAGSSMFSGQELVYEGSSAIWSMNYYGRVLGNQFNGDFLKAALKEVSNDMPFRGPEFMSWGEYVYVSKVAGNIEFFNGSEEIYYMDKKIYECNFHGGILK